MSGFETLLSNMPEFGEALEKFNKGGPVHITGITGSQKSHYIYSVCNALKKKCLVITYDETEAGRISRDLSFFFCREAVVFKNKDYVFYDIDASSHSSEHSRLKALCALKNCAPVVATVEAVSKFTLPPSVFEDSVKHIRVGDTLDISLLAENLLTMGYKRTSAIEGVGQYSIRGSIVDVFSPLYSNPVRIDMFDDEVDSLRMFDIVTQVSVENVNEFSVCPVQEIVAESSKLAEISRTIRQMKNENLMRDAEKLDSFGHLSSMDKYFPYVYGGLPTLMDYVDDDTIVFLDEVKILAEKMKVVYKEQNEIISDLLDKGLFPKSKHKYILDYTSIILSLNECNIFSLSSLSHSCPGLSPTYLGSVTSKTVNVYTGKTDFLFDDLRYWKKNKYKIIMVLNGETKVKNVLSALMDEGIDAFEGTMTSEYEYGCIYVVNGVLERGFEYPTVKTVIISDGESTPKSSLRRKSHSRKKADIIKSFEDLNKGDYVVHRTHGIGQYVGIVQLTTDNVTKDYLKIKYKGTDVLYIPTNQLESLHKYTGGDKANVKLNSLGGAQWSKTVARVKQSVDTLAEDLIALYAERQTLSGHVFPEDTPWQKEFEESFMYEETPDQLRCIKEVKDDMEQGKCMDRLLCGDVGYGKTEVAIRAAFKCVMDGLQVAYLVPTTILAQQHYNNFAARLGEYAMKVEMLSRFRTRKQQEKTVSGLKSGSVDVVIGTHRLLQKDIKFKNLGLLIIDEEQRFGVGHKEKLKELKKNVDVLTLSATPIPRTLNMAMVGIRDLSVIAEPPSDRYPVQTFVMEYNETVVRNAIQRELDRNGQVYYLYNRVEGIEKIAGKIRDLVPEARIAIAHGQMSETQLEDIMMSLIDGEIDVLVCTTIIETGLDVSNVNTIIIENSDALGLSQLYQLRGRVGRSNRLAYAYLTYNPGKILDSVAHKRLQAIKEFTEFGSGFKIAMRDLEIRGAGNLLGKQQHGNMNLVGYDMYCMLLEQAVKEKKGEEYIPELEVAVDINIDAYIPEAYIEYEQQRIEMYKKIATIDTLDDFYELQGEFIDRFGDIPPSVTNLLDISLIKVMCRQCEISAVTQKETSVNFSLTNRANPQAVVALIGEYERNMRFVGGDNPKIVYRFSGDVIGNIKIILQKLIKSIQELG